jgi:2-keto-4-pentenoate hydratase/2-oxohepta-3-ene-1,7-dioic acid hydratase in catechol pathway
MEEQMTTRRDFVKAAAAAAGTAALAQAEGTALASPTPGPRQMPRGLTLLSMVQPDGAETLAVKLPNGILDVAKASRALMKTDAPATLEDLLASGNAGALEQLIKAADGHTEFLREEATIKFGRLFTKPGKIVCVGLNYKEHADEAGEKLPRVPILFNKYNNVLAAHNCTIKLPPRDVAYKFDYETELLVVMGKTARNVSEADALDYVAGYAVGQDFSARDLQLETPAVQWMVGKTLDDFGPIGPYFVSADMVDPNNLTIETYVNDETKPRQSSHTSKFIFNPQKVISYTSRLFALEPGDIIFTGTPSGVILGMPKDKQVWLKAGDRIESRIEKLGTLKFDLA